MRVFALIVLAYLSFTAIAFLAGAHSLIFPRFILDESLGHHADRARGPLLQAVANGVSLNLLGLLAVHAYRRGAVRGAKMALLLASVPLAILATMTRAVWLSFGGTVVALIFRCKNRVLVPRHSIAASGAGGGGFRGGASSPSNSEGALNERLEERGPVDYRAAVYAGGWEMFLEHPLTGWGFNRMPAELPRHVEGYKEKVLYPHNTYLELLVEHGIFGLGLYLWLMWELWRLRRGAIPADERHGFLDRDFHRLWPILLAVYWVNAAMVVMSYQFVNGLLFTLAGMLAAQNRRAEACMLTVAYLANQFPSPVEPYVADEIEELRRRGVRVVTGSVRKAPRSESECECRHRAAIAVDDRSAAGRVALPAAMEDDRVR